MIRTIFAQMRTNPILCVCVYVYLNGPRIDYPTLYTKIQIKSATSHTKIARFSYENVMCTSCTSCISYIKLDNHSGSFICVKFVRIFINV